jgi:Na+/phosphate symporter
MLKEIRESLNTVLGALFIQNFDRIGGERRKISKMQQWTNIISANVFKSMRLLDQKGMAVSNMYPQTIRRLQKLSDGYRDIVLRAYTHVGNHHEGLLPVQVEELERIRKAQDEILQAVEDTFSNRKTAHLGELEEKNRQLIALADELNDSQVLRIKDNSSKTRLSILYYGIIGNAKMLSKQSIELLEIFEQSFGGVDRRKERR